jgi:hypothetical protein
MAGKLRLMLGKAECDQLTIRGVRANAYMNEHVTLEPNQAEFSLAHHK